MTLQMALLMLQIGNIGLVLLDGSKGLLTFLGFLGNAEFSPWKRLPEFIELGKS